MLCKAVVCEHKNITINLCDTWKMLWVRIRSTKNNGGKWRILHYNIISTDFSRKNPIHFGQIIHTFSAVSYYRYPTLKQNGTEASPQLGSTNCHQICRSQLGGETDSWSQRGSGVSSFLLQCRVLIIISLDLLITKYEGGYRVAAVFWLPSSQF